MDNLILHPAAAKQLKTLGADPPQAVLFCGERGVGLKTISQNWAITLSKQNASVVLYGPNEKNTIPIDTVRTFYSVTRARRESVLTIIIDDADTMGTDAQNALLKLLEEPNASTRFILTSHQPHLLLPTVRSRVVTLAIPRSGAALSQKQLDRHEIADKALAAQLLFIAAGLPAEMDRLINDEAYRVLRLERAKIAKDLITGTRYDVLRLSGKLTSRDVAADVVELSLKMVNAQLSRSQDETWQKKLDVLLSISDNLGRNFHVRTQLLQLVV